MPENLVTTPDGVVHHFPIEATPEMIQEALQGSTAPSQDPTPGHAPGESPLHVLSSTANSLVTDPAFRKGFVSHLLQEEPATTGALGGAAVMGAGALGAPAAIVGAAGAAVPTIADLVQRGSRALAGKPQDPVTAMELASDASGPALEYGGPLVIRGAQALRAATPDTKRALGFLSGLTAGAPNPLHMLEGAAAGSVAGPRVLNAGTDAATVGGKLWSAIRPSNMPALGRTVGAAEERSPIGLLRAGPRITPSPEDTSVVHGVNADVQPRPTSGFLRAAPHTSSPPADTSFARGTPATPVGPKPLLTGETAHIDTSYVRGEPAAVTTPEVPPPGPGDPGGPPIDVEAIRPKRLRAGPIITPQPEGESSVVHDPTMAKPTVVMRPGHEPVIPRPAQPGDIRPTANPPAPETLHPPITVEPAPTTTPTAPVVDKPATSSRPPLAGNKGKAASHSPDDLREAVEFTRAHPTATDDEVGAHVLAKRAERHAIKYADAQNAAKLRMKGDTPPPEGTILSHTPDTDK